MRRPTTIISIACLGLLVALSGVRAAIAETGRTDVLITLVLSSGMALGCGQDARRMGRAMPGAASLAVFFTWPVAIPVYLVWTRGWKRGMLAAMAFVGSLAVLYLVPFFVACYVVWGAGFFELGWLAAGARERGVRRTRVSGWTLDAYCTRH